jgi:uncharacterized membrane protein YhhN
MRSFFKNYGFGIYLVISLVHLAAILLKNDALRMFTKPLLMPLLALTIFGYAPKSVSRTLFIGALLFSFSGDLLLMFEHINPLYFIFGLVSFLLAHILYILFFMGIRRNAPAAPRPHLLTIATVLVYGISLLVILWPGLGDLKIPVAVYATVICTMLLSAVAVYPLLHSIPAMYFLAGALLFVASDSILAFNKFYQPFSWAALLIMLTYIAAQYCLSKGFVKHFMHEKRTSIQ